MMQRQRKTGLQVLTETQVRPVTCTKDNEDKCQLPLNTNVIKKQGQFVAQLYFETSNINLNKKFRLASQLLKYFY